MSGSGYQAWVGLDVGGTQLKGIAFDSTGRILAEETEATVADETRRWLERARELVRRLLAKCPSPARVGVAAPGLASAEHRRISFMPGRLLGLEGLDWEEWLGLGAPVRVFNDAQAALLGEVWLGAGRQSRNVMLLTLGTGVGGAAMVDGRILHGQIGRAGHLGHVSLDPNGQADIARTPGSLEDAIGECSLMARSAGQFATTRELIAAAEAGSTAAKEIWLRSVRALAAAVAGLINVLDPELVVIGGGIAESGEALFEPLRTGLDQFEWRPGGARVRVVKAALGPKAGATGAAYGAKLAAEEEKAFSKC